MRQEDLRLRDKSSLVGPKMYLQTQNIQRAQWECYVRHCCMWQRCGHRIDAIGEWYSTMFVRNRRPEYKRIETTAHERTLLIPPDHYVLAADTKRCNLYLQVPATTFTDNNKNSFKIYFSIRRKYFQVQNDYNLLK